MEISLSEKKAIVLGVRDKDSIAFSIALKLIESGCQVICGYQERNQESINKLIETLKDNGLVNQNLFFEKFDVTTDSFNSFYIFVKEKFQNIDLIIHSIAFAKKEHLRGRLLDADKKGFDIALEVSSFSLIKIIKQFEEIINKDASIITLTYQGSQKAIPNYNIMGVAKAALEAEIKYLAKELGENKTRINAISAGVVETTAAKAIKGYIDIVAESIKKSPMKRLVTKEEIANAALFLCSDLSSGVTGEIIHVDCGFNVIG
tara:strand:- start:10187 stop:10969 length:783 start_codon:yes stop_codon:yes gene_type:complete